MKVCQSFTSTQHCADVNAHAHCQHLGSFNRQVLAVSYIDFDNDQHIEM
jgi:hypothetical protein